MILLDSRVAYCNGRGWERGQAGLVPGVCADLASSPSSAVDFRARLATGTVSRPHLARAAGSSNTA